MRYLTVFLLICLGMFILIFILQFSSVAQSCPTLPSLCCPNNGAKWTFRPRTDIDNFSKRERPQSQRPNEESVGWDDPTALSAKTKMEANTQSQGFNVSKRQTLSQPHVPQKTQNFPLAPVIDCK